MPRRFLILLGALVLASCQTDSVTPAAPALLGLAVQPTATTPSGAALAQQPVVEVRDAAGQPIAARAIEVTASLSPAGATLIGTVAVRTNDQGRASFTDLGIVGAAGSYSIRFSAPGLAAAASHAVAVVAGSPAVFEPIGGNNQAAAAGTAVTVAPAVRLRDAAQNPVAGVVVVFSVDAGGGTLTGDSVATDAAGVARVGGWTLGPRLGANSLRAVAATLSLEFTAVAVLGPPAKFTLLEGSGQTEIIGRAVTIPPSVMLTDAFDNPVAGVAVTFSAQLGGSVAGAAVATGPLGVARVGGWTLGFDAGPQTLTATVSGLDQIVVSVTALGFGVAQLASGAMGTCGVTAAGAAYCWGDNAKAQLGDGTVVDRSVPTLVTGGQVFQKVAVGAGHACGLTVANAAYCWGSNSTGQLGIGVVTDSSPAPVLVQDGHLWSAIATGDFHACALDQAGAAWCWGFNGNGRLGDNTTVGRSAPTAVLGGHLFTAITAGNGHSCGLRDDGALLCWGAGATGRLGTGSSADQRQPALVAAPAGTTFTAVTAGGAHSCAITALKSILCWGSGVSGALGNGAATQQNTPVATASIELFATVEAGQAHSCGTTMAGALYCWGANTGGRLGDGTAANRLVPTTIAPGVLFDGVAPGIDHTCARVASGSAVCWGRGDQGQIGDGALLDRLLPRGTSEP